MSLVYFINSDVSGDDQPTCGTCGHPLAIRHILLDWAFLSNFLRYILANDGANSLPQAVPSMWRKKCPENWKSLHVKAIFNNSIISASVLDLDGNCVNISFTLDISIIVY